MGYGEVTSSASMTHLVGRAPFLTALRVVGGSKQLPSSWKAPPGPASPSEKKIVPSSLSFSFRRREDRVAAGLGSFVSPPRPRPPGMTLHLCFPISQMERSRLWEGQGILPILPGTPLRCCPRSGTVGVAPALMRVHVFRQGRTATPVPQGPASSERLMPAARGGTGALALTGLL